MDIVFATNNGNKLTEVQALLGDTVNLLALKDINCIEEIPEEQDTIEGNAAQKSHYVSEKYHVNCFADDTGLEIETLDGRPGVYSARYAGKNCTSADNITKILEELVGKVNRKARFKTVISLLIGGKEYQFEGIVEGTITERPRGKKGFGYDPVFQPEGYDRVFAEMTLEEKNTISHRALAVKKLVTFLKELA